MNNLQTQVINYLNSNEVQNQLNKILDENFESGQKKIFLKVWEQMKNLEFDVRDIYSFLLYLFNDLDKARKVDNELFEKILIEVSDELEDLYDEKVKEKTAESLAQTDEAEVYRLNLIQTYQRFTQTSLFQNILASQEQMREKYNTGAGLDLSGKETDSSKAALTGLSIKNEFYAAINAGDKIKTVGILRLLAEQGKLRDFFQNDKRFIDFFSGYLERHYGEKEKQKFLRDPANKKYLVGFLRFILEKRLEFSKEESAMIGVGIGALCRQAGEEEYVDIAFGDESRNSFSWSY